MSNAASLYPTIKMAVVAVIQGLNLVTDDGTQALSVTSDITADDQSANEFPCVQVTSQGERVEVADQWADTENFGWNYPLRLYLQDRSSLRDTAAEPDYLGWSGSIADAFHNKRLPGVDVVQRIFVDRDPQFPPPKSLQDVVASMRLRIYLKTTRNAVAF